MARRPTVVPDEISLTKVRVTLLVDGLSPKGSHGVKNGTMNVQFNKSGLAFTGSIKGNNGNMTDWAYKVRKLPSDIVVDQCTWKVEKGKVILDLVKRDSMSWESMMRRGLDQADSSDEEED